MKSLKYLFSALLILGNMGITPAVLATEEAPKEPVPVEKIDPRLTESTTGSVEERYQGLKKIEISGEQEPTKTTASKEENTEGVTRENDATDSMTEETSESVPKQSQEQTSDSKEAVKQESSVLTENSSDQPEIEEPNVQTTNNTVPSPEIKEADEWEAELDTTDNYYKLIRYIGTNSDILVPNQLAGKPTKIDLSKNIATKNLGDKGITSITFSNKNGGKVKAINNRILFQHLDSLINFDGSGLDTSGISDMSYMFSDCVKLRSVIGLEEWDTSKVKKMNQLFNLCSSLEQVDLSHFNTSSVDDLYAMFYGCSRLKSVDVSNWDTSKVENMSRMFQGCEKLESIVGLIQLSTEKVNDMTAMFQNCEALYFIDLSNFVVQSGTSTKFMFYTNNLSPLLVKTKDKTLLNYNYTSSNRYPSGPKFDANGGYFGDNPSLTTKYYFEKCAIEPTSNQWKVESFNTFKNVLQLKKTGSAFREWRLTEGTEPTTTEELVQPMAYTAQYIVDSKIPSQDIDNEVISPLSTYGVAYVPKAFRVNGRLDLSPVSQSIHIPGNYHVGVRDVRNTTDSWILTAQLQWSGKKLAGEILTTNKKGIVQKNTNNGVDDFQESDFTSCSTNEVNGRSNVVINGTPKEIMHSNKYTHDSVYDYSLNRVSLRIMNPKDIESGSYHGNVIWNLSNAMN